MLRLLVLLPALALYAGHPWTGNPAPIDAGQFPIIAWNPSPTDADSLALMKQAGINVSGFCKPADLDTVQAAGLRCIVEDAQISKILSAGKASSAEIARAVRDLKSKIGAHPAAFGVLLRDEPSVALMPLLGQIAAELRTAMPGKLPYVNLFPNYANNDQLGASYEEYLRSYLRLIPLPYLSWDNYSLTGGEMHQRFYDNLEAVRRLTLEARIPFWNCILSNALFRHMEPSDATLQLQVYATLAYGGRGIEYFTYFTPDIGNFRLAPIDSYGNQTPTWGMLRRVNKQIHALAPFLVGLRSTGVYHWPLPDAAGTPLIAGIKSTGRFVIGEFQDSSGKPWLMLVNKSLQDSAPFKIELKDPKAKLVRISPVTGKEGPLEGEGNWLAPGAGVLVRVAP